MKRKGESSWKRGWRRLAAMVCICLAACGLLGGAAAEGRGETEKTADAPKTMQLHQVDVGCANCHLLIAGDTLHGGFNTEIGSDEQAWRTSLARLTARHFDWFTFGHCPPSLLADADERIRSISQSFANYYTPWFKDFYRSYPY